VVTEEGTRVTRMLLSPLEEVEKCAHAHGAASLRAAWPAVAANIQIP